MRVPTGAATRMDNDLHHPDPGSSAGNGRPARRSRRRRAPSAALQALQQVPDSRAGLVARAARLVRDPGYPSDDMLWQIAQLLATRVERDPVSY